MSSIPLDALIRATASRQHSLITTEQVTELGASRAAIHARTDSGALRRVAPRVLVVGGAHITDEVLLHAALLEAGGRSAIAHGSAAALWELPGFALRPFQIVRRRDGTYPPPTLGTVHTTRRLPDTHVAALDGMLVTTPTRTLFDLAATLHPERLEKLIDRAWSKRLTSGRLLHRTLQELAGKGQTGITVMRELLAARGPDYVPAESNLEGRFATLMGQAGLGGFRRQVDLGDEAGFIGRVDFCHDVHKVIVEIDSDLHHTSISDRRSDDVRRAQLQAAGWTVVRVTEFDLWHRPDEVTRRISLVLGWN